MTDSCWLVVANEGAGSAEVDAVGRAVGRLAADAPVRLVWTSEPSDIPAAARAHPEDRLVVFGGDGTLSLAVDAMVRAGLPERPVAFLPGGTGNDFLRGIGSPLEADEVAAELPDARPARLSALRVGDRIGINAVHIGLGALASRRAASVKSRLGPLAYPAGAIASGARTPPWTLGVHADGEALSDGPALMAGVVLGRTIGGGTELAEDLSLAEGAADVFVAPHDGPRSRAQLAFAMLSGTPGERDSFPATNAAHVRIEADRKFPVNLDGEDLGDHRDLEVAVEPAAWTALLPPGRSTR